MSSKRKTGCVVASLIALFSYISITACEVPDSQCNSNFTESFGEIRSPNYPDRYPAGVTCLWSINVTSNSSQYDGIILQFKYFLTMETNKALPSEESLFIYSVNPEINENAVPLRVFVGHHRRNFIFRTQSTNLWLKFQASSSDSDSSQRNGKSFGFDILYSVISSTGECQSPEIPEHGVMVSTNFTIGLAVQFYCSQGYRIQGAHQVICILHSSNGQPDWSDPTPVCVDTCAAPSISDHLKYSGNMTVNSTIIFSCDPPYVLRGSRHSTCMIAQIGDLQWDSIPSCYIPDCSAPVVLNQQNGSIVNPAYPRDIVLGAKTCRWQISGQPNTTFRLSFVYFDLPADGESYLEIRDKGGRTNNLIMRLEGDSEVRNVTSETNFTEIFYQGPRENSTSHHGFYIIYQNVPKSMIIDLNDDDPHGPTFFPGSQTSTMTTTIAPISSTTQVIRHPDDGADTVKIAVGVSVPVLIGLIVILVLYLWYRKKYPVRMIVGREFAKFSNPDYVVKTSTISLIREDADKFFQSKEGVSKLTLESEEQSMGPDYENMAFQSDHEITRSLSREEEEEEEDRKLMQRKSYLFKHRDSTFPGVKTSLSDTDSTGSSPSQTQVQVEQHIQQHTEQDVEQETDQHGIAVDDEVPTADYENILIKSKKDIPQETVHEPEVEKIEEEVVIIEKNIEDIIEETKDGRRALTFDERPIRRLSFDPSLSVRGRSKSVAPTDGHGFIDVKQTKDSENPEVSKSARGRSQSLDGLSELTENTGDADYNNSVQESPGSAVKSDLNESSAKSEEGDQINDHTTTSQISKQLNKNDNMSSSSSENISIKDYLDKRRNSSSSSEQAWYENTEFTKDQFSADKTPGKVIIADEMIEDKESSLSNPPINVVDQYMDQIHENNSYISGDSEVDDSIDLLEQSNYENTVVIKHNSKTDDNGGEDSSLSNDIRLVDDQIKSLDSLKNTEQVDTTVDEPSINYIISYDDDHSINSNQGHGGKVNETNEPISAEVSIAVQDEYENVILKKTGGVVYFDDVVTEESKTTQDNYENVILKKTGGVVYFDDVVTEESKTIQDNYENIEIGDSVLGTTPAKKKPDAAGENNVHCPTFNDLNDLPKEKTDSESIFTSHKANVKCTSSEQDVDIVTKDDEKEKVKISQNKYGYVSNVDKKESCSEKSQSSTSVSSSSYVQEEDKDNRRCQDSDGDENSDSQKIQFQRNENVGDFSPTDQLNFLQSFVSEASNIQTTDNEGESSTGKHNLLVDPDDLDMVPVEKIPGKNRSVMVTDLDDSLSLSSLNQSILDSSVDASSNSSNSPNIEKKIRSMSEPTLPSLPRKVKAPILDLSESTTDEYSSSDDEDNTGFLGPIHNVRSKSFSVTVSSGLPGISEEPDDEGEELRLFKETRFKRNDGSATVNKESPGLVSLSKKTDVSKDNDRSSSDDEDLVELTEEDIIKVLDSVQSEAEKNETDSFSLDQRTMSLKTGISNQFVFGEENDDIDV